jgi:hypothetical protein
MAKWMNLSRRQAGEFIPATDNMAAIQNSVTGNVLIYRKHNKPAYGPFGDSLDDFIP